MVACQAALLRGLIQACYHHHNRPATLKMASDAGQPWFGGSFRRLSSARIRSDWESAGRGQPLLRPQIWRDVLTQLHPWPRDRLLVLVYDVDLEASE